MNTHSNKPSQSTRARNIICGLNVPRPGAGQPKARTPSSYLSSQLYLALLGGLSLLLSDPVQAKPQYVEAIKQSCFAAKRLPPTLVTTPDVCATCHLVVGQSFDYPAATTQKAAYLASDLNSFCPSTLIETLNYELRDPKAPPPTTQRNTTHEIELIAEEKTVVVATGVSQTLWTYNGTVPGPVLRVRVGDTINVHFINPSTNLLPHSVDFHASQAAWNDEMASINPGEDKWYRWTADYAGVWMYHCGTNPSLHHIASGMYGMVIVEPKQGLPKVDHEFALVQSEFYVGDPGGYTSLTNAQNARPDYVTFNGVAFQYKDHPIEVGTGKKVRFFVMNAGPSEDSAFHIVGTIFNRVIKEGMELTRNNKGGFGSQAVDLAPSQGAIVELTTKEDGLYPIVTHAFNFVGKGGLGLLKAGDGDPKN